MKQLLQLRKLRRKARKTTDSRGTHFFQLLIATFLGGAISFAATFYQMYHGDRERFQERFQTYFVTEGIDELLTCTSELANDFILRQSYRESNLNPPETRVILPTHAIARTRSLVNSQVIPGVFYTLHHMSQTNEVDGKHVSIGDLKSYIAAAQRIEKILDSMRYRLLEIDIKSNEDLERIPTDSLIVDGLNELDAISKQLFQINSATIY